MIEMKIKKVAICNWKISYIDNNWNDNKKQIFFKCRTSIFMNEISSSLIDTYFYDLDWVKIKGNQNENEIVFKLSVEYFIRKS